jgi:hypothetical protein
MATAILAETFPGNRPVIQASVPFAAFAVAFMFLVETG